MKTRTALALAAGAVAAVAIGGAALAAGGDDPTSRPSAVFASPSDDGQLLDDSGRDDSGRDDSGLATVPPTVSPSPSSSSTADPSSAAPISQAQAIRIAVRAAGGGTVTKVERETEHGRPVYDIEVRVGGVEHDIDVDRETGDVLRHERDRDDDRSGHGQGRDDRYDD